MGKITRREVQTLTKTAEAIIKTTKQFWDNLVDHKRRIEALEDALHPRVEPTRAGPEMPAIDMLRAMESCKEPLVGPLQRHALRLVIAEHDAAKKYLGEHGSFAGMGDAWGKWVKTHLAVESK